MKANDFPKILQIQTVTGCNADCIYCPSEPGAKKEFMPEKLFRKIVDECGRHKLTRISPFLMNEPLIDRNIDKKINYIAKKNPSAIIILNTNASLLDMAMARKLSKSRLHGLGLTISSLDDKTYRKVTKLHLPTVLGNVEYLLSLKPKFVVKVLVVNNVFVKNELGKIKKYWKARGVDVIIRKPTSRAGNVKGFKDINAMPIGSSRHCKRPEKNAYVLHNGDMVFCCDDWGKEAVVGNAAEDSIYGIWNSANYRALRKGKYHLLGLCRRCEYDGVE